MARSPWRTGLWTALLVVAMGAFWLTFAPTVAGGRSAYVIVAGASMEPTLRRGDLVIARAAESYQVGDIVTYQHPTVGPVIHRILQADNGTYTLQGDANDWTELVPSGPRRDPGQGVGPSAPGGIASDLAATAAGDGLAGAGDQRSGGNDGLAYT